MAPRLPESLLGNTAEKTTEKTPKYLLNEDKEMPGMRLSNRRRKHISTVTALLYLAGELAVGHNWPGPSGKSKNKAL